MSIFMQTIIVILVTIVIVPIQVTPAINLTACKYELKLEVPSAEGMTEMYLRFNSVRDDL